MAISFYDYHSENLIILNSIKRFLVYNIDQLVIVKYWISYYFLLLFIVHTSLFWSGLDCNYRETEKIFGT